MRWFLMILAAGLMVPVAASAQEADKAKLAAQREAMKSLEWLAGEWRGPAHGANRNGRYEITQTERAGPFLQGTVMVVEGRGYATDGSVVFNAFGIISYDPATKTYSMRSYALGHAQDFPLTLTDKGYRWQIPAGPEATIQYVATFKDGVLTEIGDYVAQGQPPRRIFEMNVKRIGDSDWPQAGGVAKD